MECPEESKPRIQISVTNSVLSSTSSPDTLNSSQSLPLSVICSLQSPRVVASQNHNTVDDDSYFNNFPTGYRFCPRDHELVMYYLENKVKGKPLPRNRIADVTLYRYHPEFLADTHDDYGEKEWYFFTPRDRKYKHGKRPNRAAGGGYWKATGADKQITYEGNVVGYRKALVYYTGKAPDGDKTNWIMHEFRLPEKDAPPISNNANSNDMRLDNWVLCRLYKKNGKLSNAKNRKRSELEQSTGGRYLNHSPNNHLAAMDVGYDSTGTDSVEDANTFDHGGYCLQQASAPLVDAASARLLCDSYSAAQVPILSETIGDPLLLMPLKYSHQYASKEFQEETWNPRISQFDLADTFNYYYDIMENNLLATSNDQLSMNHGSIHPSTGGGNPQIIPKQ